MNDLMRVQAELAQRMRELGAGPRDPRLAPLLAQATALMRQQLAGAMANGQVVPLAIAPHAQTPADTDPLPDWPLEASVVQRVEKYMRSAHAPSPFEQVPALNAGEDGQAILALAPADRAQIAVHAYELWCNERYGGAHGAALKRLVSDLLRAKLELSEAQALALVKAAVRNGFAYASYSPNQAVAQALKRHVESHGLSPELKGALSGLRNRMVLGDAERNSEGRKLLAAVDELLARTEQQGDAPRFDPKPDAWGRAVAARLAALPLDERARLTALLALAAKGGDNAKPAKGWLKLAAESLKPDEREHSGALLIDVVELHEPGTPLELQNQNTLRALIWLVALVSPPGAARRLEAYAQKCLTFSSAHFAYLSLVLGNAAVHAFSLLPGTEGAGSLSRLRRRLKRPGEIKTIEKALDALAQARGMTSAELEEIGLPDFGFSADGTLSIPVGPATAYLAITDEHAIETTWQNAEGDRLKGPPAILKEAHADDLKAFKARTKEIDETLRAQRLRLERLYLADRIWRATEWRARYRDDPLVAGLTRRLVWSFEIDGRWVAALPQDDALVDAAGARLDLNGDMRVKLWHPMQSTPEHVLAWRHRLQSLGVTQPFKQAHREIYVLTDAERATHTYSNRFAGHIVDQHRFRALCVARGWKCPAFGMWDPGDGRPLKRLAERELQVEFWVDPIEDATDPESFQFRYLSTDQVRFVTIGGEPIPLDTVDPVLFSELMRDADLFVAVSSIANDPNWTDHADGRFAGYWGEAAFGQLTETGKTRRAVLADLLPGLAIASRCRLDERHLVVTGRLGSYRIHLGSGNIQMEPNNQYLCIVQDRQDKRANVRLPFEGDMTLSLILSKAFMLADDDKITDPSIRSQIRGGLPER